MVITGIFVREVVGDVVMPEWQTTDLLGLMTQKGFLTLLGYPLSAGLLGPQSVPPPRQRA